VLPVADPRPRAVAALPVDPAHRARRHLLQGVDDPVDVVAVVVGAEADPDQLELVGGAVDAAATLADQVLGADPYAERAHRLAVAASMQARDRPATTAAVERLARMLDELGARPESTTQILLRNAARWLGPVTSGPASG
jgi:hypothetical protein